MPTESCLRPLVGLSPGYSYNYGSPNDEPQPGDTPAIDYTQSSLGLFAWDLVGPVLLADGRMDTYSESGDLWAGLIRAYESALLQLPAELAGFLGDRLKSSFGSYTGRLGFPASTGIVAVAGNLAGFVLPTRVLAGGSMTISKIGLLLNVTTPNLSVTVTRYHGPLGRNCSGNLTSLLASPELEGQTGEVLKTWTLDVTANDAGTYAVSPLVLPLDGSVYTISYPLTGGYLPKNNRLSGCCGSNTKAISDTLTVPLASINGDMAHGLLFEVSVGCKFSGVTCDLMLNEQYNAALGYLLYYKTALNVLEDIRGGKLSPAVQIRTEDLVSRNEEWTAKMSQYLTFITQSWEPGLLPAGRCYTCNSANTIYRGTLSI